MSPILKVINHLHYRLQKMNFWLDSMFLPRKVTCSVRGQSVLVKVDSPTELNRAITYSSKEPNTLDWLDDTVKENDIFYDIGANIGLYSLYLSSVLNQKCKIYAFEPEALNFAKLNINIFLNNFGGSITAYPIALGLKNKVDHFYIKDFVHGEASHHFGHKPTKFSPSHIEGAVGMTLDSLVYEFGLPCPNHIKIDVDGLERDVIEGGKRVFASPDLQSVLVEVSKNAEGDLEKKWFSEFFLRNGFKLASYPDKRNKTENLIFKKF